MAEHWAPEQTDQLCELVIDGLTSGDIAKVMRFSRSAIAGQIFRLKKNGDPRLAAVASLTPSELRIRARKRRMDRLADHLAEGATIGSAARKMGIDEDMACRLFDRIRKGLGRQAR